MYVEVPQPGNQVFTGAVDRLGSSDFVVSGVDRRDFVTIKNDRLARPHAVDGIDDGDVCDRSTGRCRLAGGQKENE